MNHHPGFDFIAICAYAVIAILVVAFVLLAFRDVGRLRTGIFRAWAIGRTTIAEAWNARIWAIVPIWFLICLVISLLVRPYSAASQVEIYLTILLRAQLVMLLVYLGILSCVSLPRERERRTLITTGSKPISRLELLLGKVMGICAAGLAMLVLMTIITWGFMAVINMHIRHDAAVLYAHEKHSYNALVRRIPPEPGIRYTAQHGVLQAQNYYTGTLRIAGLINYQTNPPERALKGGSSETLYFEFPSLPGTFASPPVFLLRFVVLRMNPGAKPNAPAQQTSAMLQPVKIHVTAVLRANPMVTAQQSLTLNQNGTVEWRPKNWTQFFSLYDPVTGQLYDPGPVLLKVTCPTLGAYLFFGAGTKAQPAACLALNLDQSRVPAGMMSPKPNPVITGFKSNNKQEIVGPSYSHPGIPAEVASFEFPHLPDKKIPIGKHGNFTVHLFLSVDKQENEALPAIADITAFTLADPTHPVRMQLRFAEKHLTVMKLPKSLLDASPLVINIQSNYPGHWIKLTQNSVQIVRPPSPFIVNLAKSEFIIFCEVVLLVVIGVTASARLGWPVAMLATMVCYVLGNLFHFVYQLMIQGGFGLYGPYIDSKMKGLWYYQIGSFITAVMVKMLYALVRLMPDFTKFDPLHDIIISRNLPWQVPAVDAGWTLACALPILALGYLLLRRQELA